ncbi:MAG: bifunctional metallophosphatase/5'-nucleotidase [Thermoleophilaceae bacterium]
MISPEARKAGFAAFAGASAVAALGLVATADPPQRPRAAAGPVEVQILGVNDFHGHLDSPRAIPREDGGPPVPVGGAAALDAHLDRAEQSHPGRTIRVHAGDMAGATPLISSHFHDEPSIRATNLMDFDVGTLGNHEFDEGGDELLRLLQGGQRNDGKQFKTNEHGDEVNTSAADYEGSSYPWIAANTEDTAKRLELPPTKVIERDGVKIGFIGVTTEQTSRFLLTEHGRRFRWLDISTVVNRHARELQAQGVEAIVVLAHSGAFESGPDAASGEIVDETSEMTSAVDLVVAGHSQSQLNVRVPNREGGGDKLVVESLAYGTAFDRVRLTVDRRTGHVLSKAAETPRTWNDEVTPDPEQVTLRERYRDALGGLADRPLGTAESVLERRRPGTDTDGGNLGAVAARAQRRMAGADFAFVDGHNMRASVDAGPITYAELFEAHAYEHPVMRMTLTGAEVREVLAQQADPARGDTLHLAGPALEDISPTRSYVVAANRLLVDRGEVDVFRRGNREMEEVGTDLEALVEEVERSGVVR